jgi:hypothetical protein
MGVSKEEWFGKVAVYTSVVTDFEHLGKHVYEDGVDYIYISDGTTAPIEKDKWQIHVLKDFDHLNPRRLAKLPKLNPYFFDFLRQYDYLVWIDGDMEIIHPHFVEEIMSHLDNGMVMSPHFDGRDCAYGEATIRPAKYLTEPLDEQVSYYRSRGLPEHSGLFEGGVFARDMSHQKAKELGMQWYIHNMVFSYQDQVSLPFIMWDMDYYPSVLPESFRKFNWVHINAHKHEG